MIDILELGKKRAEEIGLATVRGQTPLHFGEAELYYTASDIHQLLGEGVEVKGYRECDSGEWLLDSYPPEHAGNKSNTHQALALPIRPIARPDTAEILIKEMVKHCERIFDIDGCAEGGWLKRAKEFLSRGSK